MYYGGIKNCDIANGHGVRVSLFVSGCRNHCKGCFQPETWAFDYVGSITVKLYNLGTKPYEVRKGDKIAQLVIMPYLTPEIEIVNELEETERGDGAFGSTGR